MLLLEQFPQKTIVYYYISCFFEIPGSKEAGSKLLEMLTLGKSKPWKEVMEMMTGNPNMDTSAFREYFAPLEKWLIKHNKEKNNQVQQQPSEYRACLYLKGLNESGWSMVWYSDEIIEKSHF